MNNTNLSYVLFTFIHLADAFIRSDLQLRIQQVIYHKMVINTRSARYTRFQSSFRIEQAWTDEEN